MLTLYSYGSPKSPLPRTMATGTVQTNARLVRSNDVYARPYYRNSVRTAVFRTFAAAGSRNRAGRLVGRNFANFGYVYGTRRGDRRSRDSETRFTPPITAGRSVLGSERSEVISWFYNDGFFFCLWTLFRVVKSGPGVSSGSSVDRKSRVDCTLSAADWKNYRETEWKR